MTVQPPDFGKLDETHDYVEKHGSKQYIKLVILHYVPKTIIYSFFLILSLLAVPRINKLISNINPPASDQPKAEEASLEELLTTEESARGLKDFNINYWHVDSKVNPTEDGFYCPKNVGYPSWFLWTKKKFLLEDLIEIKFKLKDDSKDNDKTPALFVSYGDKSHAKPDVFYRVNILDGDLKTIRTYDDKDNPVDSARSDKEPNLDNELIFKLNPSIPNRNKSQISLNPEISFKIEDDENYSFLPKKELKQSLKMADVSEEGEGQQVGVGVSKGDCFKIISSNLQ